MVRSVQFVLTRAVGVGALLGMLTAPNWAAPPGEAGPVLPPDQQPPLEGAPRLQIVFPTSTLKCTDTSSLGIAVKIEPPVDEISCRVRVLSVHDDGERQLVGISKNFSAGNLAFTLEPVNGQWPTEKLRIDVQASGIRTARDERIIQIQKTFPPAGPAKPLPPEEKITAIHHLSFVEPGTTLRAVVGKPFAVQGKFSHDYDRDIGAPVVLSVVRVAPNQEIIEQEAIALPWKVSPGLFAFDNSLTVKQPGRYRLVVRRLLTPDELEAAKKIDGNDAEPVVRLYEPFELVVAAPAP